MESNALAIDRHKNIAELNLLISLENWMHNGNTDINPPKFTQIRFHSKT